MKYGLIGQKLSHSYSKIIHGFLGNTEYELAEIPPDGLDRFLREADFNGINVTIPYKQAVIPYCTLDEHAKKIGSVNTIVRRNGALHGYNTDYPGFVCMARRAGVSFAGRKVVILGSGGTSKTAACAARDAGAREIVTVSRAGRDNYENLSRHADCDVLVNTTPVGMYPDNGRAPVDLARFDRLAAVLDVIYNPLRTQLLLDAQARGIRTANGLAMLSAQAFYAHRLFFGDAPDEGGGDAKIEEVLLKTQRLFSNIVLIGMPGCGKTTIGRALARRLNMRFTDTDALIEAQAGRAAGDIIRGEGEAYFRGLERAVIAQAARETGQVIATGGGSVLLKENRDALAQNGEIVFLDRPLARLATGGRPLSTDLQALYRERLPIYAGLCRHRIAVPDGLAESVDKISEALL